jgi:hypothetical protein
MSVAAHATTGQGRSVDVVGGTAAQQEMALWAVSRFEAVRLTLPSLEVRFHGDRDACGGRLGLYVDGVVHECREHTNLWASRELLHEMAHAWLDANLTEADRDRFLRLRGLATWNSRDAAWDERGYEHGAEIIAWAIGDQADGIYTPSIPDNGPGELAEAFRVLTSRPFPRLTPDALWDESPRG